MGNQIDVKVWHYSTITNSAQLEWGFNNIKEKEN